MKSVIKLLLLFLFACGAEKMPEQIDKTIEVTNKTIEGVTRSNGYMERLLDNCNEYLFELDVIDPMQKELPEKIVVSYVTFNPELKKNEIQFLETSVSSLEIYFHESQERAYFIIPKQWRIIIPDNNIVMVEKPNSLCKTIIDTAESKIREYSEKITEYLEDNEDTIIEKVAEIMVKVEQAKINCKEYEAQKAVQDYKDKNIKWWQVKKKKELKERKTIERIRNEIYPHPCEIKNLEVMTEIADIQEAQAVIDDGWDDFKNKWSYYYSSWKEDKRNIFTTNIKEQIIELNLQEVRAIAFYQSGQKKLRGQLNILDIPTVKLVFPKTVEKLRKFLANNGKSMEIDPQYPIDYNLIADDRVEILLQIFTRYFYSGNTKEEKSHIKDFITDAMFMLYEMQLMQAKIDFSEESKSLELKEN